MAEPMPNEQEPRDERRDEALRGAPDQSDAARPARSAHGLLGQARQRFKELASSSVSRCELMPDMAKAVLHSLELGFAQTIKEDGLVMQRQFDQDVDAAVTWAAQRLVDSCRHLAADVPGRKRSSLQNLAVLEVQALEIMLPELSPVNAVAPAEPVGGGVPAARLQSFCALLNDGLDIAQKADNAADRRDQRGYRRNYVLSRIKLRDGARLLRRMLRDAGPEVSDLTTGLRGFQLELAAHAGSLRRFLKALQALQAAAASPRHSTHGFRPHCLVGDLLPTLFDRHFAFTILTPHGIPPRRSQELITTAHAAMWQKIIPPVSRLLDHVGGRDAAAFKAAVEAELRKAAQEVHQQFAAEGVNISISSNNVREIRRRAW